MERLTCLDRTLQIDAGGADIQMGVGIFHVLAIALDLWSGGTLLKVREHCMPNAVANDHVVEGTVRSQDIHRGTIPRGDRESTIAKADFDPQRNAGGFL